MLRLYLAMLEVVFQNGCSILHSHHNKLNVCGALQFQRKLFEDFWILALYFFFLRLKNMYITEECSTFTSL